MMFPKVPDSPRRAFLVISLLLLGLVGGCATTKDLDESRTSLERKQYSAAIEHADLYLKDHPSGEGAAQAMYLRGRAIEEQPVPSRVQLEANLQAARMMYDKALAIKPSPTLEAYIRASIGNIAFLQDDYTTAINQLSGAIENLDRPELRATAMYRVGVSQQRVGRFDQADQTFSRILREYPNSSVAGGARDHMGVRAFFVQLASYANVNSAQATALSLKRSGYQPSITRGSRNLYVVRIGPFANWATATSQRRRVLGIYRDALIVP